MQRLVFSCDLNLAITGTGGMRNLIYHSFSNSFIMKCKNVIYLFLAILTGTFCFSSCADDEQELTLEPLKSVAVKSLDIPPDCNFTTTSSIELTQIEKDMLSFAWEEEKMAQDVYLLLSERFGKQIFENTAASELVHMNTIVCLMIHFNMDEPIPGEMGIYENEEIQTLYDEEIVALLEGPMTNAMTAGVIIENFIISNINEWMTLTVNESILTVFANLVAGTGNHLASFERHLPSA